MSTYETSSTSTHRAAGFIVALGLAASLVADQAAAPKVMDIDQSTVFQYKYNDRTLNTGSTPPQLDTLPYDRW